MPSATSSTPQLIGVMGGAFDPIHAGHLRAALEAQSQLPLSRVLFLPTPQPPHKDAVSASYEHRRNMLALAIARHPGFEVCEIEKQLPQPHYTVNTLRALRTIFPPPEYRLCWIMGLDSLHHLATWRDWQSLFLFTHFVVVGRPVTSSLPDELSETLTNRWCAEAETLLTHDAGFLIKLPSAALAIASRELRRKVQNRQPLDYLVADPVIDYITRHRLYL